MKKKFKLWKRPADPEMLASNEFRKMDNKTLHEMAIECAEKEEFFYDEQMHASNLNDSCYRSFHAGFITAKSMIRQFLLQKQMGYGEAFFFKLSDIDAIGEKHEI